MTFFNYNDNRAPLISEADCSMMQRAQDLASITLCHSAFKYEHANRLASEVMRLFSLGHRNQNIIAAMAAETEQRHSE